MEAIHFNDLFSQYLQCKDDIDSSIQRIISRSSFIRGNDVAEFEDAFAASTGRKFAISCGNGTDALYAAFKALAIKPNDEVIVPAHTWISTAETVTQAGGKVVFCEVDELTFTIDPQIIEEKITDKTVGIVAVHLYGQPADMDPIMHIAKKHKLWIVEDCAQAHSANYKSRQVGSFGAISTYSFYPGKNLGAFGDAGAITTDDPVLADHIARFCRHGGLIKGEHTIEGINSRMDTIQAAVLNSKLPLLPVWTEKRQQVAKKYAELLSHSTDIILPYTASQREHVWHLYVIKYHQRDRLRDYLLSCNIPTVINYPTCLPLLKAYSHLGHIKTDFPISTANQDLILSLPMHPFLSDFQLEYIASAIHKFINRANP
jgi:dTDP-4-amino-4,6-dideoxygalactose transaminase